MKEHLTVTQLRDVKGPFRAGDGEHITRTCANAVRWSRANRRTVRFTFNGVTLAASPKKSPYTLLWEWEILFDRAASKYRNSAEGKRREAERLANIETRQEAVTALVAYLPEAINAGMDRLMGWCHGMAENADYFGVVFDHASVADSLEAAGFLDNAHVGQEPEFFNTRKVMGEYIVGQVINCLRRGYSPHPVTMTFVDRYQALRPEVQS